MKKEYAEKWVNALRSGEFRQCKGRLSDGKGSYCCLGVLNCIFPELNLSGESRTSLDNHKNIGLFNGHGFIGGYYHTFSIYKESFTRLNDAHNLTFDEIADVVQAEYLLDNDFKSVKEG